VPFIAPSQCTCRHEKGHDESGVGYVKKNFLNGLELSDFSPVNPTVQSWLAQIANVRIH
jgi:transposase